MKSLYESIIANANIGRQSIELDGYHIGDIAVQVFSYNARYVHFYKILDIKGKTITVRELEKEIVSDDGYGQNGTCIPTDKFSERSKEIKCRVGSRHGLRIEGGYTYKWNGKPEQFYSD